MSGVTYLLVALVLSVVLSLVFWLVQRKPKSFMSSIDEFRSEMDALARDPSDPEPRRPAPGATRPARPEPIMPAPARGDLARKLKDARKQPRPYGRSHDEYDTFDESR